MRRIALLGAVTALLATAATGSAGAVYPDTIALPNAWLPEGIAIAPGGTFYSGSRANGAVYGGSLRTGEGAVVVPDAVWNGFWSAAADEPRKLYEIPMKNPTS